MEPNKRATSRMEPIDTISCSVFTGCPPFLRTLIFLASLDGIAQFQQKKSGLCHLAASG
jgi:hypothetical protein